MAWNPAKSALSSGVCSTAGDCSSWTGSGCSTSSGTIFSMRLLSQRTSPPVLINKMTASPSRRWSLIDRVLPELRNTISAEAELTLSATSRQVPAASLTICRISIGTTDRSIRLVRVSRNATVELFQPPAVGRGCYRSYRPKSGWSCNGSSAAAEMSALVYLGSR